ncbi:outer membrane beta-barrel family protein [Flaviaesturariibacter flavus]|nr:outer membrane beta-barrel family protein [Flaviaesturariibacter flavus]
MNHLFTIIALSAAFSASAQSTGSIQGQVADGSQKTVESATISLLRASDSSVVKIAVAGKEGRFAFENVAAGNYLVLVSAVGHGKEYSAPLSVAGAGSYTLPVIRILPVSKDLAAVTITARKPLIEQKADRTLINVEASPTNVGANALEVLEKAPGVSVDKDGNVSLKGRAAVQVMIDGRPAYLSETALASYLRTLPATAIEQIEIMTNPSARYDASGNSGIINIKTKKNKLKGFNGNLSLSATQGHRTHSNNSFNLNYRNGKVNLFTSINHSHFERYQNLDIERRYTSNGAPGAIFESTTQQRDHNNYYGLKLGADYFLTNRTTLGFVLNGGTNPERGISHSTSFLKNAHGQLDSIVSAESDLFNTWKNGSVNLNFRHQFDSAGRELTADLDAIGFRTGSEQIFVNNAFNTGWVKQSGERLRGDLPVRISIYSAKTDYSQPLGKEGKLEAGLKGSYVRTKNSAFYFNQLPAGDAVDTTKTNRFNYEERIVAGYVNYNKQLGKWGLQAGLRYEHTAYNGYQFGSPDQAKHPDSSFGRNYGSLFPTVFVSYAATKKHQFSASYGRRIDRPSYQDLNPFLFFIDKFTYEQGNPFMRPQFTDNIELTHTFKGFLTTTLNWSSTRDMMNETFEQARNANGEFDYATIVKDGNFGRRNTAGIAVSAQGALRKWWNANVYVNYNYTGFTGRINGAGEEFSANTKVFLVNAGNQFQFGKGWNGELSGWYRSSGLDGQILIYPLAQVSAGVGKTILKGAGNVKLNVRDIFFTNKVEGAMSFQNTDAHFWQTRDTRNVSLAFNWRFGKPAKESSRRRAGAASDELNRVKGAQ